MSFSSEVKQELAEHIDGGRHCELAELAAIICHEGKLLTQDKKTVLWMESENPVVQKKYFTLLGKTTNISESGACLEEQDAKDVLVMVKMYKETSTGPTIRMDVVDGLLLQQTCCRRAFIRGAFLASGSMSDPQKNYHFEIVCKTQPQAVQLQEIMKGFAVDAKIVERKKHYVVYLKEGAQIVDMLNVMGAHVALMNLENVRILKEMRNSVNRTEFQSLCIFLPEYFSKSSAHILGGSHSISYGQNGFRPNPQTIDHISQSADQHGSLTAAGYRKQQHRAVHSLHCPKLLFIQLNVIFFRKISEVQCRTLPSWVSHPRLPPEEYRHLRRTILRRKMVGSLAVTGRKSCLPPKDSILLFCPYRPIPRCLHHIPQEFLRIHPPYRDTYTRILHRIQM